MNGTCVCKPEWDGMWCDQDATAGFFKTYRSGWNPLGTVLICVAGVGMLAVVIFLLYNKFALNKKGLNAVPGVSDIRSKVKGEEYSADPAATAGGP